MADALTPFRFRNEELLRQGHLTPLLEYEITEFLKEVRAAQDYGTQNLTEERILDLDSRQATIDAHWRTIFGEARTKAMTFKAIESLGDILANKLYEDYLFVPFEIPAPVVRLARSNIFDTAIDELILDFDHVQWRISALVERNGQPGNDFEALAARREWGRLASLFISDREMVIQILPRDEASVILTAISKFEKVFFSRLIDAVEFTVQRRAQQNASESNSAVISEARAPVQGRVKAAFETRLERISTIDWADTSMLRRRG